MWRRITATLKQIIALNISERIRIAQAILDSIAAEQETIDLTEPQQDLDRRMADFEANRDNVLSWEGLFRRQGSPDQPRRRISQSAIW
ncbi:MAG: addiction module protein [Elainella sp.]